MSSIHAYVSELYSKTKLPAYGDDGDSVDESNGKSMDVGDGELTDEARWECMDETALIALGILMEETARGVLGETGDFAFTEDADIDGDDEGEDEEAEVEDDEETEVEEMEGDAPRSASPTARTGARRSLSWSSSDDESFFSPEDSA